MTTKTPAQAVSDLYTKFFRGCRDATAREAMVVQLRNHFRGVRVMGKYKNYCSECGAFLFLDDERDSMREDLKCDGCEP